MCDTFKAGAHLLNSLDDLSSALARQEFVNSSSSSLLNFYIRLLQSFESFEHPCGVLGRQPLPVSLPSATNIYCWALREPQSHHAKNTHLWTANKSFWIYNKPREHYISHMAHIWWFRTVISLWSSNYRFKDNRTSCSTCQRIDNKITCSSIGNQSLRNLSFFTTIFRLVLLPYETIV